MRFLISDGKAMVDKATTYNGRTPLFIAAENGHTDIVRALITDGKAMVDKARTNYGATPLFIAAQNGRTETVKVLLAAGAKVDSGDYDKRTAIHLAASEGLLDVVICLVEELNADASPVDRWGGTPLDDALRTSALVLEEEAQISYDVLVAALESVEVSVDALSVGACPVPHVVAHVDRCLVTESVVLLRCNGLEKGVDPGNH